MFLLANESAIQTLVSLINLQFKFGERQNNYLTQTMIFLTRVELKKSKLVLEKIELSLLFYNSIQYTI